MDFSVTSEERACNNSLLTEKARAGDSNAESLLVEQNAGLVRSIAVKFRGRGIEYEDLMQIGNIGLIKAIRSFDASRGFAFSTYAVPLIMGEIKRTLRDEGPIKVGRRQKKLGMDLMGAKNRIMNEEGREASVSELAEICEVSTEEAAMALCAISPVTSLYESSDDDASFTLESRLADPENETELICDRIALAESIKKLSKQHRTIVIFRFFRNLTQQQTADALGLSQVKVSREEKKILEFLRKELV